MNRVIGLEERCLRAATVWAWAMLIVVSAAASPDWTHAGAPAFTDESETGEAEGIRMPDGQGEGARWLAIAPPEPVEAGAFRARLPRRGEKLGGSGPFTILAIGDSVTATGPYPEILAKLIARATGHRDIRVKRAAYPGCSVDAAVRRWEKDAGPAGADLALILFGLNDQGAGSPVEAYLEQIRWLVDRLHAQGADVVLMEPTPHIDITPAPGAPGPPAPEAAIFRAVGFAGALRVLAEELGVPIAPTFDALWGTGGPDLQAAARGQWPLFPASYSRPFSTLLETRGKGDTIHPNVLGHLRLARAVFQTAVGKADEDPVRFSATTFWEDGRLLSRLTLQNTSARRVEGRFEVYPLPSDDTRTGGGYALDPGMSSESVVAWPGEPRPEDLLASPLAALFAGPGPFLQVVDYRGERSRVRAVRAPLQTSLHWLKERSIAEGDHGVARLRVGEAIREVRVPLPPGRAAGRILLQERNGGDTAVAEFVFVRHGTARSGEATIEGRLDEWDDATWEPLGEPEQARWTEGGRDHRKSPAEFYEHWSFKAGRAGLYLAFRGQGDPSRDTFTLYFDARSPALLGSAGPYTWVECAMRNDGTLAMRPGDSSPDGSGRGLRAAWSGSEKAGAFTGEIFVPYEVMGITAWPESGELGFSLVWRHRHADGLLTHLMWAENGHPWNTRWYGVLRRDPEGADVFRVRVR